WRPRAKAAGWASTNHTNREQSKHGRRSEARNSRSRDVVGPFRPRIRRRVFERCKGHSSLTQVVLTVTSKASLARTWLHCARRWRGWPRVFLRRNWRTDALDFTNAFGQ